MSCWTPWKINYLISCLIGKWILGKVPMCLIEFVYWYVIQNKVGKDEKLGDQRLGNNPAASASWFFWPSSFSQPEVFNINIPPGLLSLVKLWSSWGFSVVLCVCVFCYFFSCPPVGQSGLLEWIPLRCAELLRDCCLHWCDVPVPCSYYMRSQFNNCVWMADLMPKRCASKVIWWRSPLRSWLAVINSPCWWQLTAASSRNGTLLLLAGIPGQETLPWNSRSDENDNS